MLLDCYETIAETARQRRVVTPAAEWILDNFHVVDEQLKSIARDCTPAFLRSLPVLREGRLRGWPRAYALLLSFVAHTDSRFDSEALTAYVRGYQSLRPLTLRELWAAPVMLRCLFIENLRSRDPESPQSHPAREQPGGRQRLYGRAVRAGRGCVFRAAA